MLYIWWSEFVANLQLFYHFFSPCRTFNRRSPFNQLVKLNRKRTSPDPPAGSSSFLAVSPLLKCRVLTFRLPEMTPSFRSASGHQRDAKRPFYEKEEERPSFEPSILGALVSLLLTNKPTGPRHPT